MQPSLKTPQQLAQEAIVTLDQLLRTIQGGDGLRVLLDARGMLSSYVQRGAVQPDKMLSVQMPTLGGVTLVRNGQHFTINDQELETVREAINERRREIRKRERRETKR